MQVSENRQLKVVTYSITTVIKISDAQTVKVDSQKGAGSERRCTTCAKVHEKVRVDCPIISSLQRNEKVS